MLPRLGSFTLALLRIISLLLTGFENLIGARSFRSSRRQVTPATRRCALRGARDVPTGEWDNWSDVVYPASYLDPKGRENKSMMRKGR